MTPTALGHLPSIHLPHISFDPKETHELTDPAGVSQLIFERLDEVKARERRSILRVLRRLCCLCTSDLDEEEYTPLTGTEQSEENLVLDFSKTSKFAQSPIVNPYGLSIIERVFHKSPPNKPQVIMCLTLHCSLPPKVHNITGERILDLIRIAQSKHFRLASFVHPRTMRVCPLAETADKLPLNYRFVLKPRSNGEHVWKDVFAEEINTNFDLDDTSKPLWRAAIVVPQGMMPRSRSREFHHGGSSTAPTKQFGKSKTVLGEALPELGSERGFSIIFSFHHCLGDGLSMFAFCRTFSECANAWYLTSPDLRMDEIAVVQEPPPLLDNVMNPNVFEVLPTAIGIGIRSLIRRGKNSFTPTKQRSRVDEIVASVSQNGTPTILTAPSSPIPHPCTIPSSPSQRDSIQLLPQSKKRTPHSTTCSKTSVRFLWFDSQFTSALRSHARTHGTSIASVMVVAALSATLALLKTRPAHIESLGGTTPLPTHQGWVVTNSMRHVLPQSRLLQGGDRETDPSLRVFGSFAGSVANHGLRMTFDSNVRSQCRSVKSTIASSGWASVQRMKLVNYCYRHPKLWRMIEARTDLSKMSRSFSVEVANLGAWECPLAQSDAPDDDDRLRLDYFGGVVNSSFDGVRGLFTLGIITLGGNMSIAVAHDAASVTDAEAEVFVKVFCEAVRRMNTSDTNITVHDILSGSGSSPTGRLTESVHI
ncbi:hypothetical protein BJ741DRAFT_630119 [Chytriomyces cf. hyalinus JEL632]|nr:hypothetical protein BJ741DRAFT_630119 [Chytriomyces cf. hyalinus JEL632]